MRIVTTPTSHIFQFKTPSLHLFKVQMFLLLLPFFILTVYATSDTIREGDQASLLDGSLQLAAGHTPWQTSFYNYDKQYITFWLVALLFRFKQFLGLPWSDFYLANLFSCLFLWSSVFAVVAVARRTNLLPLGLLCTITAPSFLLQMPFLSTAAVSSGFILWLAFSLLRRGQYTHSLICGLLAFAAVGARADAILVIPFLLWLSSPEKKFKQLLRSPTTWNVVPASIIALLLGRVIASQLSVTSNHFFFYPKIFSAYFVFGLGAGGLLYILCVLALVRLIFVSRSLHHRLYMVAGVLTMLLPFAFYAAQLLSARYWMLTLVTLLCFACVPPDQNILKQLGTRSLNRVLCLVLVVAFLSPLAIGVHLPFLNHPRLTFTTPTLFPTADGVMPMGAYARFLVPKLRNASSQFVDHNQAVWLAAKNTSFEQGQDGKVPILETHLPMYLRLGVTTKGMKSLLIPAKDIGNHTFFYAESRSLTKKWVELNNPRGYKSNENNNIVQDLFSRLAEYKSNRYLGIGILKFGAGSNQLSQDLFTLNRYFKGNEYQLLSAKSYFRKNAFVAPAEEWGKTFIFYSPKAFAITLADKSTRQIIKSIREPNSTLNTLKLRGADWFGKNILLEDGSNITELSIAKSAFPDWMNIGAVEK